MRQPFSQWVRSRFQTGLKPTFSMISSLPQKGLKNISILTSQCCPTMSLVRRQRHTMLTKRSFAVLMRYTLRRKHHLRYEAAQKRSQRRFFKICNNGQESFTGLYKSLTEQGICKGHQCIAYGLYMRDNGIELSEGACGIRLFHMLRHSHKLREACTSLVSLQGRKFSERALSLYPPLQKKPFSLI